MPPQSMMDHTLNNNNLAPSSETSSLNEPTEQRVKCVLVGDGCVGKTSLIVSYTINDYPTEYMPTAFDNYSVVVTVDEKPIRLQLCDTAGQDDFDSLRPLCYPETNVFLLCFSVMSPTSFHNIVDKWVPEIRRHLPDAPIILVGTQSDLRNDVKVLIELAHYNERPVTEVQAKKLAEEIGAVSYIECSSLTQKNLKEVFDTAILSALDMCKKPKAIKRSRSFRWSKKSRKASEKRQPQPVLQLRPLSDCSVKKASSIATEIDDVFSVYRPWQLGITASSIFVATDDARRSKKCLVDNDG